MSLTPPQRAAAAVAVLLASFGVYAGILLNYLAHETCDGQYRNGVGFSDVPVFLAVPFIVGGSMWAIYSSRAATPSERHKWVGGIALLLGVMAPLASIVIGLMALRHSFCGSL